MNTENIYIMNEYIKRLYKQTLLVPNLMLIYYLLPCLMSIKTLRVLQEYVMLKLCGVQLPIHTLNYWTELPGVLVIFWRGF